jgi:hypothetical protein
MCFQKFIKKVPIKDHGAPQIFRSGAAFLLDDSDVVSGPVIPDDARVSYGKIFRAAVEIRHGIAAGSHDLVYEAVGIANRQGRVIDKAGLGVAPLFAEAFLLFSGKRADAVALCPLGPSMEFFLGARPVTVLIDRVFVLGAKAAAQARCPAFLQEVPSYNPRDHNHYHQDD